MDWIFDGGLKDKWGNVISNGLFLKIVVFGVRIGWVEGILVLVFVLFIVGVIKFGGCFLYFMVLFIYEMFVIN